MVSRPNQLDRGWQKEGLGGSGLGAVPANNESPESVGVVAGNWRLVKKGIRTQLEGSNNVQRTRSRNNYILLCAQAKAAAGRQQQQQQIHGQEQPQDADADAP
ncbi:hypothetical protein ACLKA7_009979 [Drosophila subpalustris]